MVARIKTPNSITRALNYNEQKVKKGQAILVEATNFLKDADKLSFSDKLKRFHDLIALNERAKTNSLHISLNFDNADKLSADQFKEIANEYMQKIGFGNQPYLLYQHNDAAHPHVHIVTTSIQEDGKRIDTFNIGRNQSEKARKEIEIKFRLTRAENKKSLPYELKPVNVQKVQYGKAETKRAITNVLDHVLPLYKYASLAELNATLQQYNIVADRGSEDSRIYKSKGLVYRILDANKQKVGVPIKASLIYNKPTLKNIEANFGRNEKERQRHKQRVTNAIDFALLRSSNPSLQSLITALQKENIRVVLRQNDIGVIYGITYVDHKTKCVFNGSHLGKQYSANAIQERCSADQVLTPKQHQLQQQSLQVSRYGAHEINKIETGLSKVFNDLLQPENNLYANEPSEQKKFKKRRKRKQHQSHG
jgi:hypothetical protein